MTTLKKITLIETESHAVLLIARSNGTGRLLLAVKPRKLKVSFAPAETFTLRVKSPGAAGN